MVETELTGQRLRIEHEEIVLEKKTLWKLLSNLLSNNEQQRNVDIETYLKNTVQTIEQ